MPEIPGEKIEFDPTELIDYRKPRLNRRKTPRQKPTVHNEPAQNQPALSGELIVPPVDRGKRQELKDDGGAIVARKLAGQLASAPKFLGQQEIDERKLAVVNELTATALGYFAFRGYHDSVRYWAFTVDWELVISQGIGGLGRQHILRALAANSGVAGTNIAEKPGLLARNVWNREWRTTAAKEGKIIEDADR